MINKYNIRRKDIVMRRFLKSESSEEHRYSCFYKGSEATFRVSDIWLHVKDIQPVYINIDFFKVAIKEIKNEGKDPKRVDEADLSYPIIISLFDDNRVNVIDGCHRLLKYRKLGIKQVSAIITKTLPEPIYIKGKPFSVPGISYEYRGKIFKDEPWKDK